MKKEIQKILESSLSELKNKENWDDFGVFEINVENTKNGNFGDYATNVAMVLAGKMKKNPMEVANEIVELLNSQIVESGNIKIIEVVKPGYINFYLSKKYFWNLIQKINKEKEKFGDNNLGKNIKVNNEFISANPTGPLHLGNGRGGFLGDCLSNVLEKSGYDVTREYYVNDAGEQIERLGASVLKKEDASYRGGYIDELNEKINDEEDVFKIGEEASRIILSEYIKKTIDEKMCIKFDSWISEKKDLIEKGFVEKAIQKLDKEKLTFKKDDALWLKTTQFGDDKDRVLIKNDGQKTYFASDCGYILNKMERGFGEIIEIWGADHHGYIERIKAAAQALGLQGEIRFIVVQLVRLMKDGKEARMSKRKGNVVYINELIEKIGLDVTRFFFLMYSSDTHMNFDLGLAQEKSQKNPIFYVQYAHARMSNILKKSKIENQNFEIDYTLLIHEKELDLMKELNKFPEIIEEIAQSFEVQKLPHYAIKLADKFHSFYNDCQVIDEKNLELTKARLELTKAAKIVLKETLNLVGVSAPERM